MHTTTVEDWLCSKMNDNVQKKMVKNVTELDKQNLNFGQCRANKIDTAGVDDDPAVACVSICLPRALLEILLN